MNQPKFNDKANNDQDISSNNTYNNRRKCGHKIDKDEDISSNNWWVSDFVPFDT